MSKGKTKWYPRNVLPIRNGIYECAAIFTSSAPPFLFDLEWDGIGFLVPVPMRVVRWRGMTKVAYMEAIDAGSQS